jgi:hypothetical protein
MLLSGTLLPGENLALSSSHLCDTRRTVTPVSSIISRRGTRRTPDVLAPSHGKKNKMSTIAERSKQKEDLPLSHCPDKNSLSRTNANLWRTTDTLTL